MPEVMEISAFPARYPWLCRLQDDSTLASLMAEVSDPVLQRKVQRLSLAAARADGHLADGESWVVEAARHHWQLVDGQESSATTSTRCHAA